MACEKKQTKNEELDAKFIYIEPLNMIYIEGGKYIMFSSKTYDDFRKDEKPVEVYISSFKMSSTEITQDLSLFK